MDWKDYSQSVSFATADYLKEVSMVYHKITAIAIAKNDPKYCLFVLTKFKIVYFLQAKLIDQVIVIGFIVKTIKLLMLQQWKMLL